MTKMLKKGLFAAGLLIVAEGFVAQRFEMQSAPN